MTAHESRMLIGGALVQAADGRTYENINPATERSIGSAADGGLEDMDRAIAAARTAFDETSWALDRQQRAKCIEQLRDALYSEREQLRPELVAEVGCTISSTYTSRLDPPLDRSFDWFLQAMQTFAWERDAGLAPGGTTSRRTVRKEAMGVIAAITAWNSPVELALAKLVPALATGNTVVLKPAPDTPFTTARLGRIIAEKTDIPPGVVNVVTSAGHAVGELLTSDPRVDMVSFTGSVGTGRRIMRSASDTLKRLQLELGGKAAHLVLDDADFESAVAASMNICLNAGQSCGALSRLLVPRAWHDRAVDWLTAAFAEVKVGDPMDPDVSMGPLANGAQREAVLAAIARAVAEGATLVYGGGVPAALSTGYFVEPTLLANVDPGMEIAREEVFGPVLSVIAYDDEQDAIAIANDTPYGLSAAVSSGSDERGLRVAARLRAGAVSVNGGATFARDVPFGGYKQSGLGRQNGPEGLEAMVETKTVGFPVR